MASFRLAQDHDLVRLQLPQNPVQVAWRSARDLADQLDQLAAQAKRWPSSGSAEIYNIPGVKLSNEGQWVQITISGDDELAMPSGYTARITAGLRRCAARAEAYAKANEIRVPDSIVLSIGKV